MDVFWAAPPISRSLTLMTLTESVLVYGGMLNGYRIAFFPGAIFKLPPDLWRFMTSFLLTGPKLAFLFDLYFMYTYASYLERGSARFIRPGDFFVYVIFVCTVILITAGFLLGNVIFTSALISAFVWSWSQDNRGRKVHFYVVEIPAEWLPLTMLVVTLVSDGWGAVMVQACGIVAAHLYDFITRLWPLFGGGRNYMWTPAFVQRFFGGSNTTATSYGAAHRSVSDQSSASSGWSSAWSSRGSGRRLGGN